MKKYYFNIFLVFVAVLGIMFFFSSLVYSQTVNNLEEKHALKITAEINKKTAALIDGRLHDDYGELEEFIRPFESLNELNEHKDTFNSDYVTLAGFFEITENGFLIDGETFSLKNGFDYYQKSIAIYRFSDALSESVDETEYCFFKYDNYVAYFPASLYFASLFLIPGEYDEYDNFYLITNKDGYIGYRGQPDDIGLLLFDDVLIGLSSADKAKLLSGFNAVGLALSTKYLILDEFSAGDKSYFVYTPLAAELVIIQVFPQNSLFAAMPFISRPIVYLLAIMAGVFILFILLVFYYLNKRNNDIHISKLRYYYTKPIIFNVSGKGVIKGCNQTARQFLLDYKRYKTITDFEYFRKTKDPEEMMKKQEPFTVTAPSKENNMEFIRFISVKKNDGYYFIGEIITAEQKDQDYYRNMALYNVATNLPNKNYLNIKLQELYRSPDFMDRKNALVAIEVTSFKNINRLYGQKIGINVLIKIANTIKSLFEGLSGTIYNIETETFMILFTNLGKYQDAVAWSEKISGLFEKPINIGGNLYNVNIKIGIFEIDPNRYSGITPVSAYDFALLALSRAKESRRTNVVAYDIGMGQVFTRTQAMELDLASALKNKELKIFYQPLLNTMNNRIVSVESLLRWDNPKYALDSPAAFIELAEQNNMILEIGKFVINETFRVAKELEEYQTRMSINISPVQILQSGFVYDITSAYDRYKIKKDSIVIEITENLLMESFDAIIDKLIILKKHGFLIHLDNFGIGYSSLLYLKDLPIDGVSIGRDFIKSLESDKNVRTIVSKIISLANSLEIDIVAEGVETREQKAFLNQNGCFIIQGYLFSKAVDKQSVVKLLIKHNMNGGVDDNADDDTDHYDFLR